MANKVKSEWLGGRVDEELKELVEEYIDNSAEIETVGQLMRAALREYMRLHPIEEK
jgi:hypothetical protein